MSRRINHTSVSYPRNDSHHYDVVDVYIPLKFKRNVHMWQSKLERSIETILMATTKNGFVPSCPFYIIVLLWWNYTQRPIATTGMPVLSTQTQEQYWSSHNRTVSIDAQRNVRAHSWLANNNDLFKYGLRHLARKVTDRPLIMGKVN